MFSLKAVLYQSNITLPLDDVHILYHVSQIWFTIQDNVLIQVMYLN